MWRYNALLHDWQEYLCVGSGRVGNMIQWFFRFCDNSDCELSWDSENGQSFAESAFIDHNGYISWLELTVKSSLSVLEEIISNQILL